MHLDAKSNRICLISNFYAFRLFNDYRESTVQFKRHGPLFNPGIELQLLFSLLVYDSSVQFFQEKSSDSLEPVTRVHLDE